MDNNINIFVRDHTRSDYEYRDDFSEILKTNSGLPFRVVVSKRGLFHFIKIVSANFTSFFCKSSFCEVCTEFILNPKTLKGDIDLTLKYIELLKSEDDLIY